MKLVTIKTFDGGHPGVLLASGEVLDLSMAVEAVPAAHLLPRSWAGILAAEDEGLDLVRRIVDRVEGQSAVAARLSEAGALAPFDQASLAAPIPRPALLLAIGTNYRAHMAEFGAPVPKRPGAFIKSSRSVIGPGAPIVLPSAHPDMVDYEAEFCLVIGRPCHEVSEAEAMDYVLGYTLANDVSARNWAGDVGKATNSSEANQASMANILGKNFPTFAPIGPAIVTKDEIADGQAVKFQSVLNGEVMQNGDTADMIFSIPWLVSNYSKHFELKPGDILTTGSPPGVGLARKPPVLLRAGDVIEIRSDQIGSLKNPVVAG